MSNFFELKHRKKAVLKNLFVFFLLILITIYPNFASLLGLKNDSFVKEVAAQQVELLTTSGTWTAPANVYSVTVECWGAGGGGGGPNNKAYSAGGGGGAYSSDTLSVTPSSNYSYTIGTGGAGGASGSTGTPGGDTYWVNTSTVLAKGGSGGGAASGGGAGGSSTSGVGSTKYSGGSGGEPTSSSGGGGGGGAGSGGAGGNASGATAGTGTADYGGNGGAGTGSAATGNPGSTYGGAGGGTYRSGGAQNGGAGANGVIRITYTAASNITVGTTGTQGSSVEANTSDFYVGGAFTFVRSDSSTTVTSIKISETGTISDTNISGLILYYKQEATCSTSIPGDATQFNSTAGTFTSGSSTVTGSITVGTSQICVYAEVDIGSASNGDTVEIEITDPSTDVTASAGNVSPSTAVAISGTTTVQVNMPPNFVSFSNDSPKDPGEDITFTSTTENEYRLSDGMDSNPRGGIFKPDGTTMYIIGANSLTVYQYALNTAWDISTASYTFKSFGAYNEVIVPSSLRFSPEGTSMYILGTYNDTVYQYTLSTAWDVSTASYTNKSFSVSTQESSPYSVTFKSDGMSMYIAGNNSTVYQYTLSTAWDVSTASYASKSFYVGTQENPAYSLDFKPDGTSMYIVGPSNDTVYQYTLSTAWDVSTASYASKSFYIGTQESNPYSVTFKFDGTTMYVLGVQGQKVLYQYTLSTAWDVSTASFEGSDPNGDSVMLLVCKTQGVSGTSCDGGATDTLCSSSLVTSNPFCTYSVPIPTPDGNHNAYPYVFDSNDLGSSSSLQGLLDTYTVNNVGPVVSNVTINGGSAINLSAGSTKAVDITGTITDNNSCNDISTVLGYGYRSGVGYTGETNTTSTYYVNGSDLAASDPDNAWDNETNVDDGNTSTVATATSYSFGEGSNNIRIDGTSAPTSGDTISQVRVRAHNGSSWGNYSTITEPPGGWDWPTVAGLEFLVHAENVATYTVGVITYVDGDYSGSQLGTATVDNVSGVYQISMIEIEVTHPLGCNMSSQSNYNYCYPDITCTVDTGTCTGDTDASADYTCTANLQYFADPTDTNTQYPDETWKSTVKATDDNSLSDNSEVSTGVELNSLMAFNITNEVNYGALGIGESNDPLDRTTLITPTGNIGLAHEVSGPSNMCTDFPTCSGYTIAIGNQKYALSSSTAYSSATALSTTPTTVATNIPKPITTTPIGRSIWWGMLVPEGTNNGSYDGTITVTGFKSAIENWVYAWYDSSWSYRVKISIDSSMVSAALTDFPVYLDLSLLPTEFHTYVNQTDARDIRVTTSDRTTEVPREVGFYDSTTDTGELHFKANISSTSDTDFYIYYGNTGATDYATDATYGAENVWNSTYAGVWHLNESSGTGAYLLDQSGNNNHATPTGTSFTQGMVNGARSFPGNSIVDYVSKSSFNQFPTTSMTTSFWVKTSDTNADGMVSYASTADDNDWIIFNSSTLAIWRGTNINSGEPVNDNIWHHIAATWQSSNGETKLYIDGAWAYTGTLATGTSITGGGTLMLAQEQDSVGGGLDASQSFGGIIDELRILNEPLSADWISTEYNNQFTPSTFFTIGTHEVQ